MMLPKHPLNPQASDPNPWKYAKQWLNLDLKTIQRLGANSRAALRTSIQTYAQSTFAGQQTQHNTAIAQRQQSSDIQNAIKAIITIAGAFTFGAGMRIIASGWGILALPAGALGGAIASLIVDRLAVQAYSNRLSRQETQQHQSRLLQHQSDPDQPPLSLLYHQEQHKLLLECEGKNLQRSVPINAILATSLSVIEYAVALWIVQNAALLSAIPLVIRMIAAVLPIALTHGVAHAQAHAFEMPRRAAHLSSQYRDQIIPHPDSSDIEINHCHLTRLHDDGCLNAWLHNLIDNRRSEPTPTHARLRYEIDFFRTGWKQLAAELQTALSDREKEYQNATQNLPTQYQPPELDTTDLTEADIAQLQQQQNRQRDEWLHRQQRDLEATLEQDLDRIRQDYKAVMLLWEDSAKQSQQQYDRQRERPHQPPIDDPDQAA